MKTLYSWCMKQWQDRLLIRKRRVKYARLQIDSDGQILCVVPWLYSKRDTQIFLMEKERWLLKQLRAFEQQKKADAVTAGHIRYLGQDYRFVLKPSLSPYESLDHEAQTLCSNVNLLLKEKLEDWYWQRARVLIPEKVDFYARRYGFSYRKVAVRSQKSLWGSCTSENNLSFNVALIKCPEDVLDYVVVHELAHTRELNHSARFWKVVEEVLPNYKQSKLWFKGRLPGELV